MTELETLIDELEQAADRLRDGSLGQAEAAALVERVAELAGQVGGLLEREARASGGPPGQETLL